MFRVENTHCAADLWGKMIMKRANQLTSQGVGRDRGCDGRIWGCLKNGGIGDGPRGQIGWVTWWIVTSFVGFGERMFGSWVDGDWVVKRTRMENEAIRGCGLGSIPPLLHSGERIYFKEDRIGAGVRRYVTEHAIGSY